jgi:aldehyde dehydrogenase (NAD+)
MTTDTLIPRETALAALPEPSLLIGDERLTRTSRGTRDRIDPTTGEVLASFPIAGAEDVDRAVERAWQAFPEWRDFPADERRRLLYRLAETVRAHEPELKLIQALETGSPISRISYDYGLDHLEYYAGWVDKHEGELVTAYPRRAHQYVKYQPYGVVAAIPSWNGPINGALLKLAPALAAGNCVVLKTPVLGPFAIQRLIELFIDAGLPAGVVNVISGDRHTTQDLVLHPRIRKISFTGSPDVATALLQSAAVNQTPMVAELGGKSANIVFADADIDNAAQMAATMSTIASSGQGCLFPTRLLVHDSVYDEVVEKVRAVSSAIVPGNPLDRTTVMGPVIETGAVERILGMVDRARESGARLIVGGSLAPDAGSACYVLPTVLADVDPGSELAQDEVFGPVLAISRFTAEKEAIATANATQYGLAAYLHTRDIGRAHRVAGQLEAGWIGVNAFPVMKASAPFGGIKASGFGREGGREGIAEYVYPQSVYIPLDD